MVLKYIFLFGRYEVVYFVEVKVRLSTEDVDMFLAKSEAVYKKLGKYCSNNLIKSTSR